MSFVGRARDLQQIHDRFAEGARVVTLVGPGGVGKTALSLRASEDSADVWFCELAEATSASRVCEELARAANVSGIGSASDPVEALGALIARRGAIRIILDNCEQATKAIASSLARWLVLAPEARWLATSREALGIDGESVLHVAPLSRDDAVTLFVERAAAARDPYVPTTDETETIATIVQRLDGLPLAIEIAAARMAILGADDLLERIEKGLGALVSDRFGAPSRQRTMRAMVAWSWSLLEPREAATLEQCAVFRGGFTVRAAEAIVDSSGSEALLDVIQALSRKSLVRTYAPVDAPGEVRLALYETVREYALEQPVDGALDARHARYFIDAASRALVDIDRAAPDARASAQRWLSLEHDNLLQAHAVARGNDAMRAMLALTPNLRRRTSAARELELLDATLGRVSPGDDEALRGWLLASRSRLMMMLSRFSEANANLDEALRLARLTGDKLLEGRALIGLFSSAEATERFEDAARFVRDAAAVLDGTQSRWRAVAQGGLAVIPRKDAEREEALAHFEAAQALWARECDSGYDGTAHYRPAMHAEYALLLMELGRAEDAARQLRRAFAAARDLGPRTHALLTYYRAAYLHWTGDLEASIAAYRAAAAGREGGALYQPLILGGLGAALASAGRIEEAEAAFEEAESIATLEPVRAALSVQRGHLDLARKNTTAAQARLSASATSDVRLARVTLLAALVRPSTRTLEVASDAAWFKLDGHDARVAQRLLQRLLSELVTARLDTPGRALTIDDVCRVVWPGERILPRAARRRVQVAISTLRASGLRDVLRTTSSGYLLDPDVTVKRVKA